MRHLNMMHHLIVGACTALLFAASVHAGLTLEVEAQPGWDIYTPPSSGAGYRYGPSVIIYPSGTIDVWTAAPPDGTTGWDSIKYRRSTDGGVTWNTENVALSPTAGSRDALSVCDPAVVYFGGYYYMGYTSTENTSGLENDVYVARSRFPNSGFQKWNGTDWGGDDPQPFIEFSGLSTSWGAGEPSFVVKDDTLYVYYTWLDATRTTRVATVSASDSLWPAHLTYQGTAAINNSDFSESDEDSMDVKYIDEFEKFIGVTVNNRFSADSSLRLWESDDGLSFTPFTEITVNTEDWAHNAGLSAGPDGHINLNADNFIAYAYSQSDGLDWARWATHLNPITISASVPEPGMGAILCTGGLVLCFLRRRRGKAE